MRLLQIVFVLVLMQVISSLTYDELARDKCFKSVYVCGDHRVSITGGTGRLATEPHRFSEICRKNKEFIACVEQAADFCTGEISNVSRIVLDNRRSLKLFCTDFEWKRNYFSSAKCINDHEKRVAEECMKEEKEFKDDRPYWCLIPEPCEALERVFFCTIRKMKQLCGSVAAEVHRRMHILKTENRDVVCELRQRSPLYCLYERQRPSPPAYIKRIGTLSVALSQAINNVFESALVDTMDNFALLLNEENLSNIFDSEEYKLRKWIFKTEVEDRFGPFFKKCKLPKSDTSRKSDLTARGFSLLFGNIKTILAKANHEFGSIFHESVLKSCGTDSILLASCLEKLEESGLLKSLLSPIAGISQELKVELKSLKNHIIDLLELLSCNEDFLVESLSEDSALIHWYNMKSFPLQTLSCEWIGDEKTFQCSFQLRPSDQANEEVQPGTDSTLKSEKVNGFVKPFIFETSLYPDSGSGMVDFMSATGQEVALDTSPTDTSTSEVEIGESGQESDGMLKSSDLILEDMHDTAESTLRNEKVNEFLRSFILESTGLGSGEVGDFLQSTSEEEEPLDSSITDTPRVGYFDIHRSGELVDLPEEKVSDEDLNEELVDIKLLDESNQDKNKPSEKDYEHSSGEAYILVNPPHSQTDPVSYLVVDKDTIAEKSYSDIRETSDADSVTSDVDNEAEFENEYVELQLRKIINALDERFADVQLNIFDSKTGRRLYPVKQKFNNPEYSHPLNINESFRSELENRLKEKLNEYIEMYTIYSQRPANSKRRATRAKRGAGKERKNSKFDKSFDSEESNESVRKNSKFMNLKAEL